MAHHNANRATQSLDPRERTLSSPGRGLVKATLPRKKFEDEYRGEILREMLLLEVRISLCASISLAHLSQDKFIPNITVLGAYLHMYIEMRPILTDFLIEAHDSFALVPETLFLTVNILDRYYSKEPLIKTTYQLTGCASFYIASKYHDEKGQAPLISELELMCCGLYTRDMFAQMERKILDTLEWQVGYPTPASFLQVLVKPEDGTRIKWMALYLSEISLFNYELIRIKPSIIARSALFLARIVVNVPQPSDESFDEAESRVVKALSKNLFRPPQILRAKYSVEARQQVSHVLSQFLFSRA